MKQLFVLILIILSFSCTKKVVQLPETTNKDITEVLDVSPIYMFYNEENDSIEFNRKNMISTTNWLVNIDKRLTLKQILPHLQYLQEKRQGDGMHKNENARNYFTCNNTDLKNLSFIEFSDVVYKRIASNKNSVEIQKLQSKEFYRNYRGMHAQFTLSISVNKDGTASFVHEGEEAVEIGNVKDLLDKIISFINVGEFEGLHLEFWFHNDLTFQDYITIKSRVLEIDSDSISFSNDEIIYY